MGLCGMSSAFGIGDVVGVLIILVTILTSASPNSNYVCSKKFVPIGKKCYFFSKDETIWHDAHFRCGALNSTLAVVTKPTQEMVLRRYLNRRNEGRYERWLGGTFNEKQSKWIWGASGKQISFHGFSRINYKDKKWAWHCIVVDPAIQNKWSARNCLHENRYICQKRGTYVDCTNSMDRKAHKKFCHKKELSSSNAPGFLVRKESKPKPRKHYELVTLVCPSDMILIGRKCYFFSVDQLSWSDAYWACRDKSTKFAVLTTRMQDKILRGFLKANFTAEKHERWIGGIFDWRQDHWIWAMSGKRIKYQHFTKDALLATRNHTQHCITLDPEYNHLWNSKDRLESKHYICQAKPKSVMKIVKDTKPSTSKPQASAVIKISPSETSQELYSNNIIAK